VHALVVALRNIVRRPAFTLPALLTLALGAGAVSAAFTLLDAVLLRPPAYPHPERLVFVWQTLPRMGVRDLETTPADFGEWTDDRRDTFESLALVAADSFALTGDGDAERVRGARVSASMWATLGVAPELGRAFSEAEDVEGNGFVVVLSHNLWRRRFAARPQAVGQTIDIDGRPHRIVGVMPATFVLPEPLALNDQLWVPLAFSRAEAHNRVSHNYTVIGRLRQGISIRAADATMAAWARRAAAATPDAHKDLGARAVAVRDQAVKDVRTTLIALVAAAGLVMLIACSNLANLSLARIVGRRHELAVRAALGASRMQLAGLLVAESLLVALGGGALGLVAGGWALRALWPVVGSTLPASTSASVTGAVVVFTLAASLAGGLLCGAISSVAAARGAARDGSGFGDRSGHTGPPRRTRAALVVSQVALATMLLAAVGVLIRSLVRLSQVDPGYSVERVLTFRVALPDAAYAGAARRLAFVRRFSNEIASLPGVERAGVTSRLPLGGSRGATAFTIDGRVPAARDEQLMADQREVTPGYFSAMRIRVLSGRPFDDEDDENAQGVAMVNKTMAARFWPGENPVGRRVALTVEQERTPWLTIVGVVDDVKHTAIRGPAVPEMYRPLPQWPKAELMFVVRARNDQDALWPAIRARAKTIDDRLPLFDVRTMQERVDTSISATRVWTLLLGLLAALAVTLAAVGIYGALWCSVAERTRDFGIRLALGAGRGVILRLVTGEAFALTATGLALGLVGALASTRLVKELLFDTTATDPIVLVSATAALLVLAMVAALIPAARAIRVDPGMALRSPT
jgi:putative ABC transport system permease protein